VCFRKTRSSDNPRARKILERRGRAPGRGRNRSSIGRRRRHREVGPRRCGLLRSCAASCGSARPFSMPHRISARGALPGGSRLLVVDEVLEGELVAVLPRVGGKGRKRGLRRAPLCVGDVGTCGAGRGADPVDASERSDTKRRRASHREGSAADLLRALLRFESRASRSSAAGRSGPTGGHRGRVDCRGRGRAQESP